jgi:hypothetical protein
VLALGYSRAMKDYIKASTLLLQRRFISEASSVQGNGLDEAARGEPPLIPSWPPWHLRCFADETHLAVPVPRRLWKRERIVQLEQQPEWKERRAQMDATALAVYDRDMAAVRAARPRNHKRWAKQ